MILLSVFCDNSDWLTGCSRCVSNSISDFTIYSQLTYICSILMFGVEYKHTLITSSAGNKYAIAQIVVIIKTTKWKATVL